MAKLIILSETTKQMKVKSLPRITRRRLQVLSHVIVYFFMKHSIIVAPPARRRLLFKTAIQWPGLEYSLLHGGCARSGREVLP